MFIPTFILDSYPVTQFRYLTSQVVESNLGGDLAKFGKKCITPPF